MNPELTDPSVPLRGGELNAAITREVIRIHNVSLGRGPGRAFSFHNGNIAITVMHDVMTQAERRLSGNGDGDAVRDMRERYQRSMEEELKESVERLTGRKVVATMSDNHLDPDMALELFVLDGPLD